MTTPSDPNQAQLLTPEGLANQLFDVAMSQAIAQKVTDPREAARRVVGFLTDALFYAITSSKNDVIAFMTETLVYLVSAQAGDEASRKELLKHVGDTIANAPLGKPATAGAPGKPATAGAPGKP